MHNTALCQIKFPSMGAVLAHDFFAPGIENSSQHLQEIANTAPIYSFSPDPALVQLTLSNTNILKVDLSGMQRLRRLLARACPQLAIVNGSLPHTLEYADFSDSGIGLLHVQNSRTLARLIADGCVSLRFGSKVMPSGLEELAISKSGIELISLKECAKLRVFRASQCKKLQLVDDFIPPSLCELQIDGTMIQYADLQRFEELEKLNVADNFNFVLKNDWLPKSLVGLRCSGDSIAKLKLQDMKRLQLLDISGNINLQFTCLPTSLKMLNLSKTGIRTLDVTKMHFLQHLNISSLIQFSIVQWYLPKSLCELFATDCDEFPLNKSNLFQLKNLQILDISNTYFETTRESVFPKTLRRLVARGNSVKFLDLSSSVLEELDINSNVGCEIRNIPTTLKYYNIGGNSVAEIALSLFPHLEELHMEENKEIRLISNVMPATLQYLNIHNTGLRNLDFSQVTSMKTFVYDDEQYHFKDGLLPAGLREYKTTRIADLNIYNLRSLQFLDISNNQAIAQQYRGIYYKISATLRKLCICGESLEFLDLTEADSLEQIVYDQNEHIQIRDGVLPPHIMSFTTKYIKFLDFNKTVNLFFINLSDNIEMMRYYAESNSQSPTHFLTIPASTVRFIAHRATVQYLDLTIAQALKFIYCCNTERVWFKDGFVPTNVLELRSSQVQYLDLYSASSLEILDISNNKHISIRNGYLPGSLKQLLFRFEEEEDSLYSLTLKLQHLKELIFIDCTNNPNVNFDGDFVPSNVEIVKLQRCRLITKLNLAQARTVKLIKIDAGIELVGVPSSLELLQLGDQTIEVYGVLKQLLSYQEQVKLIQQLQSRIANYQRKLDNFREKQQSQQSKGQPASHAQPSDSKAKNGRV